jgi:uncharacterized protein with LGFP repeats
MVKAMWDAWVAAGSAAGPLGQPVGDPQCGLGRGGCGQLFQGGSMYWSSGTGAFGLFGGIGAYWAGQRWEQGPLGYPTGAMTCGASGCSQAFEGGQVVWSAATGSHTAS